MNASIQSDLILGPFLRLVLKLQFLLFFVLFWSSSCRIIVRPYKYTTILNAFCACATEELYDHGRRFLPSSCHLRPLSQHCPLSHHPLGWNEPALAHWQVAPRRSPLRAKMSHTKSCEIRVSKTTAVGLQYNSTHKVCRKRIWSTSLQYALSCTDRSLSALPLCT